MAVKRMFALSVVDSDAFLDMPLSSQALYFHLSMRADDDGFINNPKKIQRTVGATDGDAEILVIRKFIIPFETGVIVIRHWKLNNYLRSDRYHPTVFQKERNMLSTDENGAYVLSNERIGIPVVDQRYTENSIDKNRLDKTSIDKSSICCREEDNKSSNNKLISSTTENRNLTEHDIAVNFLNRFNSIDGVVQCQKLDPAKETLISIILNAFEPYEVEKAFEHLEESSYLTGKKIGVDGTVFQTTFSWFINLENFKKVCNGDI